MGRRYFEESEQVQIIPESAHKIELAPFIYEFVYLLIPARRVHPEDENGNTMCNPEIIKKLNELSKPEPDSRWDSLKGLITEN